MEGGDLPRTKAPTVFLLCAISPMSAPGSALFRDQPASDSIPTLYPSKHGSKKEGVFLAR